jgi:hypothetical protein
MNYIDGFDTREGACEHWNRFNVNDGRTYSAKDLKEIYGFVRLEEPEMFEKGHIAFPYRRTYA